MADVAKGIIDIEINTGNAAAQLKALQQQINAFTIAVNKNNKFQSSATAKYTTELQDLINASRFFTAETVKMRTSAGALDATLRKGQATLGQFFNARFNRNSALFAETMGLAAERARTLQTQFIATTGASRGMQEALAIRPLAAFSSEMSIATQRSQILTSMFKQGTTQLINFGKNVQWAGRQLMVGFTLPLTVFGTTAGRTFMELEKQAVAFKKVYGDIFTTPAELQGNMDAIMALGKEYTKYGIAVKDTVGLAAQAAASGARNKNLTDAVTQATRLATLGQMDQNQALDTTIALQSAFRLSGQELADTVNFLNMVENQTVVSLQDLAAAIPRVAPVIKGLGGDVRDMAVFLAAMQEGGVSAEQGANALKSGLGSLINPTKQAKEMLAGFNINLDAIIQRNRGDLMGTVTDFARALQTLDEFSRQQALEQVFGKFQYARLGALFENIVRDGSQASQVLDTMAFSSEQLRQTAEKELSVIEQSFGVQLTAAIEKFKLAIAPIGQLFVEMAIPVVNFITRIVEGFNNLPDFSKKFIALATIITGLVIPAGTMFFGLLMNLSGTLAKLLQSIGIFTKGMMKGGVLGGIQAVTQSMKYMSLEEIDAAIAAKQLGNATMSANDAFRAQVGAAEGARVAVKNLGDTYQYLIARMAEAASLSRVTLGTPGSALQAAQVRSRNIKGAFPRRFATGGKVPGSGNQDTVPAMLTPGEFVVTKDATKSIGTKFLEQLNMGGVAGYETGTEPIENKMRLQAMMQEAGLKQSKKSKKLEPSQRSHTTLGRTKQAGPGGFYTSRKDGYVPEGVFYQEVSNRVVDISANFNQAFKEGYADPSQGNKIVGRSQTGVSPSSLYNDINTRGLSIFNTMDDQYAQYLINRQEELKAQGMDDTKIKRILRKEFSGYRKQKRVVLKRYKTYLKRLSVINPNYQIRDNAFAQISNFAFKGFATDSRTRMFHDELLSASGVRMGMPEFIKTLQQPEFGGYAGENRLEATNKINKVLKEQGKPLLGLDIGTKRTSKGKASGGKSASLKNVRLWYENFDKPGKKRLDALKNIFGKRIKGFSKGGSVPSLLTPGEFVVNKQAAAANRPFLDALNAGQVKKFQLGGGTETSAGQYDQPAGPMTRSQSRRMALRSVGSRIGGAAGAAAFPGLILGPMLQQSSNKAASALGSVVTGASIAASAFQVLGPVVKALATRLPFLTNPVGLVITGLTATAGILTYVFNKQLQKMTDASAAMTRAMYGSSEGLQNFAQAYGRQTFRQQAIRSAAANIGGATSQESQQFSSQFMQGNEGKQLLDSITKIRKEGGDAVTALRNQLSQAVISGLITTDEAKAIAADVGVALNDQKLAVNAVGAITQLLGPNGEKIDNNTMQIIAEISPKFNFAEIQKNAEEAYAKDTGFIAKLFGDKEGQIQAIANKDILQQLSITTENYANAVAKANQEYSSGAITLEQYNQKIKNYGQAIKTDANKATEMFAKNIGVSVDKLGDLAKETTVVGGRGGGKVLTQRAKQIQEFFKQQRAGVDTMLEGLGDKTSNELINGVLKFAGGEGPESALIFSQMLTGTIDKEMLNKIVAFLESQGLKDAANAFKNMFSVTPPSAIKPPTEPPTTDPNADIPIDTGQKSKIQLLEESIAQTKEYSKAVDVLIKRGLSPEAAANLDAATAIELVKKKRLDLVKAINDQAIAQRVLNNVLKSKEERRIDVLEAEADAIDSNIDKINEQIDAVKRLDEADQRQITIRQNALDQLSKKEDAINTSYNARIDALNKVKEVNAQLAEQERNRIDLATALTSGDIAAAAGAQVAMTQGFAANQIDSVQAELDLQRQREIEALTVSVNGQLLTRKQIQDQIDAANQRMYERDLQTWPLQDQITNLELKKQGIVQQINAIQDQIRAKQLDEERRSKTLVGYYKQMAWWANQRSKGTYNQPPAEQAVGGAVKKAFGGLLRYTSNEPAPGMAMGGKMKKYAVGNIVPGLGNTDKVPALLTPGEFVVRKSVASENMDFLKALNGDVFPSIKGTGSSAELATVAPTSPTINNTPVYTYNVNVNVPNTDASPEEIANVVVGKLRRMTDTNLRGNRL